MAILPDVPGCVVCIQSFDQDLPEFPDDGEWTYGKFSHLSEGTRVSTYVECQTDAEFRIRIVLKHPYRLVSDGLTFRATVDGIPIAQATCSAERFARTNYLYMEILDSKLERLSATDVSSRKLKFSSIQKVDDHDSARVKKDAKLVSGIGEIEVSVFRTCRRLALPIIGAIRPSGYEPPKEVAEKALKGKAISHGVAYGEQEIIQRSQQETIDIDGPDNPIGVFVFKYRSRDDLKSEMIIPRSPSPEPQISNRRNSGNARQETREAKIARLKRELDEIKREDGQAPRRPKREADDNDDDLYSDRAYKTSRGRNGSVLIDLTDD